MIPLVMGSTNYCHQETANETSECGGINIGSYNFTGVWLLYNDAQYDGNLSSFDTCMGSTCYYYVNYTNPEIGNSARWTIKAGNQESYYFDIPTDCFDQTQLQIKITDYSNVFGYENFSCMNSTNWTQFGNISKTRGLYEESVYWEIDSGSLYCYQETANVSNGCGGLSTGNYSSYDFTGDSLQDYAYGNFTDGEYMFDGDWNTNGYMINKSPASQVHTMLTYIDYVIPDNAVNEGSKWLYKGYGDTGIFHNYEEIPSGCWSVGLNQDYIRFRITHHVGTLNTTDYACKSSVLDTYTYFKVGTISLGNNSRRVYDDGISWHILFNDTKPNTPLYGDNVSFNVRHINETTNITLMNVSLFESDIIANEIDITNTNYECDISAYNYVNNCTNIFDGDVDTLTLINMTGQSSPVQNYTYVNYTYVDMYTAELNLVFGCVQSYGCGYNMADCKQRDGTWKNLIDSVYNFMDGDINNVTVNASINDCVISDNIEYRLSTYDGHALFVSAASFIYEASFNGYRKNKLLNDSEMSLTSNIWNSSKSFINNTGTYEYYWYALTSNNNSLYSNYTFEITDEINLSTTYYSQAITPGQIWNFTPTLLINTANATYNISIETDNNIQIDFGEGIVEAGVNHTFVIELNNSLTTPDGTYVLNMTILRIFDNYLMNVTLVLTSSVLAGNVYLQDESDLGISLLTTGTSSPCFTVNNTGTDNLSNVTCALENTWSGYSFWSFDTVSLIEPNQTKEVCLNIVSPSAGTYTDLIQCYGAANELGGLDYLEENNRIRVTLQSTAPSSTGAVGGGGGGSDALCSVKLVDPKSHSKIILPGTSGEYSLPSVFYFENNGDTTGEFTFEVTGSVECEFKFDQIMIEPNSVLANEINCLVKDEVQIGEIYVNGCGSVDSYDLQVENSRFLKFIAPFLLGGNIIIFGYEVNVILIVISIMGIFVFGMVSVIALKKALG